MSLRFAKHTKQTAISAMTCVCGKKLHIKFLMFQTFQISEAHVSNKKRCDISDGSPLNMPAHSKLNFPNPNDWKTMVEPLGKFPRKVYVSMPCVGIDGCGTALYHMGMNFQANNVMDLESRYAPYLTQHLGTTVHAHKTNGDITKLDITKVERPVDVLCSGPPCPPWAGNGLQAGPMDERSEVFLSVLRLAISLIKVDELQALILENVRGITFTQKGHTHSFMEHMVRFLEREVPEFNWDVCTLNASQYALAQQRCRVFLRGLRTSVGKVPEPLAPFGEKPLAAFLSEKVPSLDWSTLTKTMTKNLQDAVKALRAMLDNGELKVGDIVIFPLDRAEGKVYKRRFTVNLCPTLTTTNKYLFLCSMDLNLPEKERSFFRFLHESETCLNTCLLCCFFSFLFFTLVGTMCCKPPTHSAKERMALQGFASDTLEGQRSLS